MKPVLRVVAAVLAALCVLTGCSRVVSGQVAMTVEALPTNITCGEFVELSDTERIKAVNQIISDSPDNGPIASRPTVLVALAGVLCEQMPRVPLKDLLQRVQLR
ncbi:MAG: hypothetical protein HYZ38_28880 [Mycobacterium sp.]|nr:hypothetical protein [Mycobacterium sp.]